MDKRGVKILLSCIACTIIVSILFMVALRISRLSCELVSIEPQRLRVAQLEQFDKKRNKPIRSYDKLMLMKISGYLEYNIMHSDDDADSSDSSGANEHHKRTTSKSLKPTTAPTTQLAPAAAPATSNWQPNSQLQVPNTLDAGRQQQQQQQQAPIIQNQFATQQAPANNSINNNKQQLQHPSPSQPQLAFSPQQLQNSSFAHHQTTFGTSNSASLSNGSVNQVLQRADKRFLPLELESIETRTLSDGASSSHLIKQKFILSFNCTKMNMVFVYQNQRVYVESMSLELKPTSHQKTHCELELRKEGEFIVDSAGVAASLPVFNSATNTTLGNAKRDPKIDHLAHYYCNKPMSFSCRHFSRNGPSSSNGLLLAELHLNAIEFETATLTGVGLESKDKRHLKQDFKSRRSECGGRA